MIKSNTEPPTTLKLKEIVRQYKEGLLSLNEASLKVASISELTPEIVSCFLKAMKRKNLVNLNRTLDRSAKQGPSDID